MAAIHVRGKNGDNSILVGKGLKMQISQQKLNCSKKKSQEYTTPYTISETQDILLFLFWVFVATDDFIIQTAPRSSYQAVKLYFFPVPENEGIDA